MKTAWLAFATALLVLNSGCASLTEIDRSSLNHEAMDIRSANQNGEPSPNTGLRNLKKASGGESCTVCAH